MDGPPDAPIGEAAVATAPVAPAAPEADLLDENFTARYGAPDTHSRLQLKTWIQFSLNRGGWGWRAGTR